jgi:hypothetical protein
MNFDSGERGRNRVKRRNRLGKMPGNAGELPKDARIVGKPALEIR